MACHELCSPVLHLEQLSEHIPSPLSPQPCALSPWGVELEHGLFFYCVLLTHSSLLNWQPSWFQTEGSLL